MEWRSSGVVAIDPEPSVVSLAPANPCQPCGALLWSDITTRASHPNWLTFLRCSPPTAAMASAAQKKLVVCGGNGFLGTCSHPVDLLQHSGLQTPAAATRKHLQITFPLSFTFKPPMQTPLTVPQAAASAAPPPTAAGPSSPSRGPAHRTGPPSPPRPTLPRGPQT